MNLSQIWQATLGTMQLQTSRHEFDTWLRDTALLSLESGVATIGTPSPFSKESLENRYMAPVRRSLGDVVGFPVQVRVVIAPRGAGRTEHAVVPSALPTADAPTSTNGHNIQDAEGPAVNSTASRAATAANYANGRAAAAASYANGAAQRQPVDAANGDMVQLDLSSAMRSGMLNPRYTFSRFIVGSSNRLAHAASYAVSEHPAGAYNPLFLYGGVGLGKTHLLHAIGNYALDRDPEITVMYVTSEKFTNDMINAIRRQQTEEFRLRYRNIDILLIDDIQFIAGKEGTQEEFFHTFNTLHSAGKQIVISSDKPPKAILTLEERLRSRFEWGLIVDVQSPDLETRTAILRAKSEQMRAAIAPEVLDFLAHKIQSNIRELEGSLNRVAAFAELNNAPITIELATAALAELFENTRRRHITPDAILHEVAGYYSMDLRIIQGRGRSRNVVVPRQVAMYLLREETDMSLVDIGGMLGGRDHTTVMYGCEKMTDEINADARLRADINAIRAKLYAPGPVA